MSRIVNANKAATSKRKVRIECSEDDDTITTTSIPVPTAAIATTGINLSHISSTIDTTSSESDSAHSSQHNSPINTDIDGIPTTPPSSQVNEIIQLPSSNPSINGLITPAKKRLAIAGAINSNRYTSPANRQLDFSKPTVIHTCLWLVVAKSEPVMIPFPDKSVEGAKLSMRQMSLGYPISVNGISGQYTLGPLTVTLQSNSEMRTINDPSAPLLIPTNCYRMNQILCQPLIPKTNTSPSSPYSYYSGRDAKFYYSITPKTTIQLTANPIVANLAADIMVNSSSWMNLFELIEPADFNAISDQNLDTGVSLIGIIVDIQHRTGQLGSHYFYKIVLVVMDINHYLIEVVIDTWQSLQTFIIGQAIFIHRAQLSAQARHGYWRLRCTNTTFIELLNLNESKYDMRFGRNTNPSKFNRLKELSQKVIDKQLSMNEIYGVRNKSIVCCPTDLSAVKEIESIAMISTSDFIYCKLNCRITHYAAFNGWGNSILASTCSHIINPHTLPPVKCGKLLCADTGECKAGHVFDPNSIAEFTFNFKLTIVDATGRALVVNVFNNEAEQLLGCTANELFTTHNADSINGQFEKRIEYLKNQSIIMVIERRFGAYNDSFTIKKIISIKDRAAVLVPFIN